MLAIQHPGETWYDFYEDWDLIESSIAQQYGIRIRKELKTIKWKEVKVLLTGLLPDTPLGKVVEMRSENDKNTLKNYTPTMNAIRNKWRNKQAKELLKNEEALNNTFLDMERSFASMFGSK